MKRFPDTLKAENKDNFPRARYKRLKCYLRRDLYEHILSHEEDVYFSLDDFNKRVNSMEITIKLVKEVISELEKIGWKCKTSYGGTALFIYSTENPPHNCWQEDQETLS